MNYDVKEGFLTCTGIGHKILFDSQWEEENCLNCPALIRFHLARRFCHQIFTWISDKCNERAICERSTRDKYFFCWNSASNSINCSLEKAVRLRRVDEGVSVVLLTDEIDELSSSSLSLVVKLCESWLTKRKTKEKSMIKKIFENFIYVISFVRVVIDLKTFEIMDWYKMLTEVFVPDLYY